MKTLGIKFEVAGVKEAQASLDTLRNGLDSALSQNKKAIADYRNDVKRGWQEWKIANFGTISQKQNLTIRQEKREFRERSTYKDLSIDSRGLVLEFRLAYKDFFTQLEKLLEEKQNPNIFEKMLGFIGKPIGFAVDAILFPFQSAIAGAFERMGEVQVQDFAEGFNKNFQRSLGLSFEETGGDVGKIIGNSLYKVYQKSIDGVDQYVRGTLQFNLADTLIDAFKYTVKTLAKELPALALRTHRRIQINKNAIPEARRAAGLRMIENDLPEATRKDIEKNKSITLVYGGANTDKADIGKDYTARVMKPYLKGSAVIPMTRQWTNSAVDSQFQGDIRNLIKLVLSNQVTAQTFKGFISENGLNALAPREQAELVDGLDLGGGEIDLTSVDRIAELVESLIENKDFALGKALQATFKGYNPDDVLGAAEAIALMQQFPDKDLQIGGFSHGGYNALGTVDLLNRMGYDQVKGFSIGTPITGANATVNPDNFRAFMGDKDYYYKALTGLAGDNIDFPEFFELGEGEGIGHSLQKYVRGDNLKGGLQAFLGDRVSLPSNDQYSKHDSAYGYGVGELGAETALVRTLMTYLGENQLGAINAKEGFIFSAEETLPGYTQNIKKLGQELKDQDSKKFHVEYIDFLETLQEELEIAEQLAAIGKQYKPVESLKRAAKIFPQMEKLAEKHDGKFDSSKQSIFEFENNKQEIEAAKLEAAEKEKFVFFQRKVKQQKDNIERTFQAMLGRNFSKKDESKGIYSFYNPEDYDTRAGNFEGMVNWLENDVLNGASEPEKEQAKPILDLLKKITASIRETGSTGQLDLSTVREAEQLLGIDLKEFDLLFGQFERNNQSSIDVNQYKDELRTFRRNRDQLINERVIPDKIDQSLDSARAKISNNRLPELTRDSRPVENPQRARIDNQQIIENYNQQLNQIIERANQSAIAAINNNDLDIDVETSYITVRDMILVYRNAVTNGLFEQARETGELILDSSEYLKQIFNQSGDSRKGQLTRIQNEVINGDRGAGRSSTPLAQIFQQTDSVQLQLDLWDETAEGARESLNPESGRQVGSDFAEGIIDGATDELDINSPSKVFEWIGKMVKAGLDKGVAGISNFASELNDAPLLENLLQSEAADERVNDFLGGVWQKFDHFFEDLKEKFPILGRISDFLMNIGGDLLQAVGLFSLGDALIQFTNTALAASMQMESLERSIISVSNSAADGANNIRFVREEAKRLSIDLTAAGEAYKRILGATRNTPLEGLQTQQLFTTLATTARNRGLTTDAANRLFLGFEQVIAKGEFKSEEVRGQLSEVLGDIQPLLASSVGVPISQLGELMGSGALKAPEVMPKLMAQLNAQNAAIGDSAGTAQAAQTRLNNAILEYQDAVGRQLQPVQKMGLNSLASALELLRDRSSQLVKLFSGLFATVLTNLTLKLLSAKFAVEGLKVGIVKLIGLLTSAPFLKFAAMFALMTAAIEVWSNVIKLASNPLPELRDEVQASAKRLAALEKAFNNAAGAAKNFQDSQPKQLQLNEGKEVGENRFLRGLAGGDRWNLDNLFRNRSQRLSDWQLEKATGFYKFLGLSEETEGLRNLAVRKRPVTQAQRKQNAFLDESSKLISDSDRTLMYGNQAKSVLDNIAKLDEKARGLQSQRLSVNSGDTSGLKKAIEAEQAVLKERDLLLGKTASYSESLQGEVESIKNSLLQLDELDKTGGSEEEKRQRAESRKALGSRLTDLQKEKKIIDEISSRIPTFLSQLNKVLRNSDERVKGFIGNQEDNALVNRNEVIKDALAEGLSDTSLELKLDNLSSSDLKDRIEFINKEVKALEDKLGNAYLQEGIAGLESAAKKDGLELTPETLERMLTEGRSAQENEAANVLLKLNQYQGLLAQSESGLLDSIKTNQSKLKDFNKTISDYFFRITQQIQEAQIEVTRLINQIVQTQIRNKLESALSPNAESFANQLISSTQSLLDQAASYAEKVLGQKGARIQFAGQKRTLELELQDFARNVSGANDALAEFERRLRGGGQVASSNKQEARSNSSGSFASKTKEVAGRLGIDPHALMTIMLFESAGTLDPKKQGPEVVRKGISQGKGRGLIQFMPATARGLGTSDAALAGMSQLEQLDWVEKYFAQFKGNFGAGKLENLYAAVLAGDPRKVNSSDGYITARAGAVRMMREYGDKATFLLGRSLQNVSSNILSVPSLPTFNSNATLPPAPEIAQAETETKFLIAKEEQKLDLQDSLINNQEKETFTINLDNAFKSDRRKVNTEITNRQYDLDDQVYAQFDLLSQYNYQTPDLEAVKSINSVNKAFSDRFRDISRQVQYYDDEISALNQVVNETESLIALAQTDDERKIIRENEANAKLLLPVYQENLGGLKSQQQELVTKAEEALYFIREQNKLKIEQDKLNKANTILIAQGTLAEARGTLEQQRQIKLKQEEQRLELEINQIRQNTPEGVQRNEEILGALRQSKVNKKNINYDSELAELDIERKLLDYQVGIDDKKAGFLQRLGFNFGADKLRKRSAIDQENNRYKKELIELEKTYAGEPEKLDQLKTKAQELNQVNLEGIKYQFKDLKISIADSGITAIQGFFNQVSTNFFDGKAQRDKSEIEERLRYAEEIVQLENQYREEPGKLAHLKNRARELNEEKLDKIKGEFNGFKQIVTIAGQALLEFTKQLAAIAAQQAAAKFISGLVDIGLGSLGGSKNFDGVKLNKAPKVKAFKADQGITVGNYKAGGDIKNRKLNNSLTNWLLNTQSGVKSAWKSEGEGAQLGVFHTGEELLSRKTGEAGRYQALKYKLGLNPLDKIANYSQGGTVPDLGTNILSGFNFSQPRIDLSGLNKGFKSQQSTVKNINVHTTVVTPNADSFRLNQDQLNQDLVERMRRGI